MNSSLSTSDGHFLQHRELLRIYAFYRVAIAVVLLGIFTSGLSNGPLGNDAPMLYLNTVVAYAALNTGWLLYLRYSDYRAGIRQIGLILTCDIFIFMLLIQASGGLNSGLGYLLLINCSVGSLLLNRRMGAFIAALASLGVIGQQLYGLLAGYATSRDIVSAGGLGILLFVAVSALQYLSTRIQSATLRAEQQRRQAEHLQQLAQQIVERMHTGVLVLNAANQLELSNRAARRLLGEQLCPGGRSHAKLLQIVDDWRCDTSRNTTVVQTDNGNELRLSFAKLRRESGDSTLIFIEDNRKLIQAAQKLKLASLGHLTASIAHEVRNPLFAISHAAQLLSESSHLNEEDRQLIQIICRHSQRVNQIIENVTQLSRSRTTVPKLNDLREWIQLFIQDYRISAPAEAQIHLEVPDQPVHARFDPEQLTQVVTNLCDNALRHSFLATGQHQVEIAIYYNRERDCATLEIIDSGHGVPEEYRDKIFEPFFTTSHGGSGLGLYIARELCASIQASLYYCRNVHKKSCFRIEFAHSNRFFE